MRSAQRELHERPLLQRHLEHRGLAGPVSGDARAFYEGKLRAARYWFRNEMPRIRALADVIAEADDAFFGANDAHF